MKIVSPKQLIAVTQILDNDICYIHFPKIWFRDCFFTIFLSCFFVGLFAHNIMYSISVFLLLFLGYYTHLFMDVWKIYRLSKVKLLVFQGICGVLMIVLGFLTQKPIVATLEYIFLLTKLI